MWRKKSNQGFQTLQLSTDEEITFFPPFLSTYTVRNQQCYCVLSTPVLFIHQPERIYTYSRYALAAQQRNCNVKVGRKCISMIERQGGDGKELIDGNGAKSFL